MRSWISEFDDRFPGSKRFLSLVWGPCVRQILSMRPCAVAISLSNSFESCEGVTIATLRSSRGYFVRAEAPRQGVFSAKTWVKYRKSLVAGCPRCVLGMRCSVALAGSPAGALQGPPSPIAVARRSHNQKECYYQGGLGRVPPLHSRSRIISSLLRALGQMLR